MNYQNMLDDVFGRLSAKKIDLKSLGLDKKTLAWWDRHQRRTSRKNARAAIAAMVKRNPKLKNTLSALD